MDWNGDDGNSNRGGFVIPDVQNYFQIKQISVKVEHKVNRWLSWSLERSCMWSQTECCTCISTFEPTLSFDLSSPQLADERLWAERLHACVEPLPLGGAALGLCLDLVVHLLGSGLLLLLGPPFCSRYQSYTHPQLKGIYCADSCCFLRVFWKHDCSFTCRVQIKSSESRPKNTTTTYLILNLRAHLLLCSPLLVSQYKL